ncbi:HNH endonuclease [Escherichia coli]|uniref:HNH endonuclease n=1 Tax=Escherichia coli TaxID=562 RepID=UPI003ADCECFB
MPSQIPRACRKRGCAGTTTDSAGYCDKHRGEGWVKHQRGLSRHQRGYGSKWDTIRARVLKRDNHLCQNCLRNGRAVEAGNTNGGQTVLAFCAGPGTVLSRSSTVRLSDWD